MSDRQAIIIIIRTWIQVFTALVLIISGVQGNWNVFVPSIVLLVITIAWIISGNKSTMKNVRQ
ncbi:hypothetical protein GCM10010916_38030 [Paenibacillus abyssi]|uniref:Uncharacterized protein n=1 Tax=Paenibacillus abyssi TaxID=1340531 RepID=A0A917G1H6_9BACL|nr:hypothetical protein GCM10010916_38030 [Paenibacillus abyssi]